MRSRSAGLHTLVGAYVMDAVHEKDRTEFERHLLTCEPCREEVRGLREATARLGAAASMTPRAVLRELTLRPHRRRGGRCDGGACAAGARPGVHGQGPPPAAVGSGIGAVAMGARR